MFHPECNKYKPDCKVNIYNIGVMVISFGKWLFDKRQEKRLTQTQLGERAGISTSYISTIERAQRHSTTNAVPRPSEDTVERLATALDIDLDEARIAAGYLPKTMTIKPTNAAEFIHALESLGVGHFENIQGIHHLTPDEYEAMLKDLRLVIEVSLRRKQI